MYSAQLRFARNQALWPAGKSGPNCKGVHRRILKLENFLTKSGKSEEKNKGREMGCTCTEEWWFQEQQKHPSSIHSYIHELTSIAKGKATHHSVWIYSG